MRPAPHEARAPQEALPGPRAAGTSRGTASARQEHEPLLLWLMNQWAVARPLLLAATEKLNPTCELLLLDCRTMRESHVSKLDARAVLSDGRVVESTALRAVIAKHPFLYTQQWATGFAKAIKASMQKEAGRQGVLVLLAFGDAAEHAADQAFPLPDFCMNVAPFYMADLDKIAEHALKQLREQEERAREQQERERQLQLKRAAIEARVAAGKAAQGR